MKKIWVFVSLMWVFLVGISYFSTFFLQKLMEEL